MSTPAVHLHRRTPFVALIALTLLLAACSSGAGTAAGPLSPAGGPLDGGNGGGQAGQPAASAAPAGGPSGDSPGDVPLSEDYAANLMLIKTGSIDLEVKELDPALATASQRITALGGFLSGSSRQGSDEFAKASVTYRIPSARWDEALVAVRGLAEKVLGEQSQTQDVTGQVVDLTARITNLQATEQAFQTIMSKATRISDVLEVQAHLTEVRGQIEQATAERKHLQEQAAYSTLTVTFSLKQPQAVETTTKGFDPATEVDQASASIVGILQGLATAGIWFGIVWLPILIALGVLAAIVVTVLKRLSPARPAGVEATWPTPPAPGG